MNAIPATSYQLPATSYQLPATSYQLPATSYQLPATADYVSNGLFCQPLKQAFSRFCEEVFCFARIEVCNA
ncbi:hypothetical protein [Streptococcus acidominimus]|uniref:hypothetical protein n=1 Tax=Streptococcus acidominimus TaxID=1326 RepID=UPI0018838B1D|nr:hypothetical protein [Streptococcus acidominimus]MBF0818756.1 hypothetical protein [Streptococcus acidominimus]